ncbi:MAG: hypothetical protein GX567_02235 [Clostridia bacterium]|nr:hypothetical protein [Clostridia bacterium]
MKTNLEKLDEKLLALAPEVPDEQTDGNAESEMSQETATNTTHVLQEMAIGVLLFAVIIQVFVILFSKKLLYDSIGLWVGAVTAILLAVHMKNTIEAVMDQAGGRGAGGRYALIRYVAVLIIFIGLFVFKIGNPVICFAGIMGLKIGAYMQPFIHKLLRR